VVGGGGVVGAVDGARASGGSGEARGRVLMSAADANKELVRFIPTAPRAPLRSMAIA
jgi:hypothetical protein